MIHKLSEIDRTLLSAYLDNEVSAVERLRAEQLLASSGHARAYLGELRAVGQLSEAGVIVPAVMTSLPGATRLTGSAIETIARRAAIKKAMAFTALKIAGVATTAAAVVTGVVLITRHPVVKEKPPTAHARVAPRETVSPVAAQPVANLDTNVFLVPPMTAADLYAFAVHGTLPMDSKRERFITVAPKGKDSLEVHVHADSPVDLREEFKEFDEADLHILDSIQRVIRTSLIQYSNGNIALRADIPSIRLGAIRTLERAKAQLPAQLREQLNRTRAELDRLRPELAAENALRDMPPPRFSYQGNVPKKNVVVPYMVLSLKGGFGEARENHSNREGQFLIGVDNRHTFSIDQNQLGSFESRMSNVPPPPFPLETVEDDEQQKFNVVNAGVRPVVRPRKPRHAEEQQQEEQENDNLPVEMRTDAAQQRKAYQYMISVDDTLLFRADSSLRSARRSIIRIDTMLNRIQIRTQSRGGKKSIIIMQPDGSMNGGMILQGSDDPDGPESHEEE
ncbi:MAG: hypothetical protein JWQ98_1500 [Chlorobi bacterium]|nr:hypothetical protein [Chlorobiota bacterium]